MQKRKLVVHTHKHRRQFWRKAPRLNQKDFEVEEGGKNTIFITPFISGMRFILSVREKN